MQMGAHRGAAYSVDEATDTWRTADRQTTSFPLSWSQSSLDF
jgi:hypothetical protein